MNTPLEVNSCCRSVLWALLGVATAYRSIIVHLLGLIGIDVSRTTAWRASKRARGTNESPLPVDHRGRAPLLTSAQKELIAGYVYHRLENRNPVNNREVHSWVTENLGVTISYQTICVDVKKLGFTPQKPRYRKSGSTLTAAELGKMYFEFLTETAHPLVGSVGRWKIASIDFTYTSCKNDTQVKLGVRGGYVAVDLSFRFIVLIFFFFFVPSSVLNQLQRKASPAIPTAS